MRKLISLDYLQRITKLKTSLKSNQFNVTILQLHYKDIQI